MLFALFVITCEPSEAGELSTTTDLVGTAPPPMLQEHIRQWLRKNRS
jgi:hypothetical protein